MSMSSRRGVTALPIVLTALLWAPVAAQQTDPAAPVEYRLTFPAPEHRWLQVEVAFPALERVPLELHMSSASPGRYARHEFAKNIVDLEITDGQGRAAAVTRPETGRWDVTQHDGTVRVTYRLFGDRVDGTYLGVDATHAHLNMPATLVWARGLEERPVRVTFERPAGRDWNVATQLYPTDDPLVFTAPNLQYLLDSPAEFSDFALRTFEVADPADPSYRPTFRVAVHHDDDAGAGPVDAYTRDVERIVREMVTVFGEFPRFETDTYSFIADYLTYADGDAMEHRNSTVLTSTGRLSGERNRLLGSVAHEFFHVWNVERIRPRSLEPFDFTAANVSEELWLAEGFTNYYGALVLQRSGVADLGRTLSRLAGTLNTVLLRPGRELRSAVEMSRMAPFVDAATAIDPTNFGNSFISYYTWGEAIGLGLDLTLRVRSSGRVTLDDYMRALWTRFGSPGGRVPGVVDRPYTLADTRTVLGAVAGDQAFADEFFARYIEGHDVVDYATLLARAGLALGTRSPGQAWLGRISFGRDARVTAPTPYGSPLHDAGVDRNDVIVMLDDRQVSSRRDVDQILSDKRPGDTVAVRFLRRGLPVESSVTLVEDPRIQLLTVESTGGTLTPEQRAFREDWLGSRQ